MSADNKDTPSREMTLGEQLQEHIKLTDKQAKYCEVTERKAKPPVVQEIVLARRHLEDANQRLKRAYNMLPEEDK